MNYYPLPLAQKIYLMPNEKMLEQIFSTLRAYLHQDALEDFCLEDVLQNWIKQLTPTDRTVIYLNVDLWLAGAANAPSFTSIVRRAAPDWKITERKLKAAFRKVKENARHG